MKRLSILDLKKVLQIMIRLHVYRKQVMEAPKSIRIQTLVRVIQTPTRLQLQERKKTKDPYKLGGTRIFPNSC